MPMLDEEDEYSLIESQLEKQRRLKMKEDRPISTEALINQVLVPEKTEDDVEVISSQALTSTGGQAIQSITSEFSINATKE